jgi:hypothetical protein
MSIDFRSQLIHRTLIEIIIHQKSFLSFDVEFPVVNYGESRKEFGIFGDLVGTKLQVTGSTYDSPTWVDFRLLL